MKNKLSEEERKLRKKEADKRYREKHREKLLEKKKIYRENNKEYQKEYNKQYRQKPEYKNKRKVYNKTYLNKEETKEKKREYAKEYQQRSSSKEVRRLWDKKRRENPKIRIGQSVSASLNSSLKTKNLSKNKRHWEDITGYTVQELKKHLESLFKPGMSWDNYGEWHIDHIIPKSFFEYASTDDVEFKYCWSLNNLQPLWAIENIIKGGKVVASLPACHTTNVFRF